MNKATITFDNQGGITIEGDDEAVKRAYEIWNPFNAERLRVSAVGPDVDRLKEECKVFVLEDCGEGRGKMLVAMYRTFTFLQERGLLAQKQPRQCAVCHRPIEKCDGFVKAGDITEVAEGKRVYENIREICKLCVAVDAQKQPEKQADNAGAMEDRKARALRWLDNQWKTPEARKSKIYVTLRTSLLARNDANNMFSEREKEILSESLLRYKAWVLDRRSTFTADDTYLIERCIQAALTAAQPGSGCELDRAKLIEALKNHFLKMRKSGKEAILSAEAISAAIKED